MKQDNRVSNTDTDTNVLPELLAASVAYKMMDASPATRKLYSKLYGAGTMGEQLASSGVTLNRGTQSLATSIISQVMALEEASPLHILRTFQFSNLLHPFIENTMPRTRGTHK
jgi:hypothetical protein